MQETQERQVRSLGQEDPLEGEVATHSSILAGTIPWSEESGGLQSIRSQRVGYSLTYDTRENKYLDHSFGRRGTLVSCGRLLARSLLCQPANPSGSPGACSPLSAACACPHRNPGFLRALGAACCLESLSHALCAPVRCARSFGGSSKEMCASTVL